MKKVKNCLLICIIFVILTAIFSVGVFADDGMNEADELLLDFRDILPEEYKNMSSADGAMGGLGIDAILDEVLSAFMGERGRIVTFLFLLLGICVLSHIGSLSIGENRELVSACVSSVLATVVFGELFGLISEVALSLSEINAFFSLLTPIMLSSVLASGGTTVASTSAFGMNLTMQICSLFSERVLLLISSSMFLSGIVSSIGGGVGRFALGIKNSFIKGLGLLSAVLMGTLSLQTLISAGGDNVAMRAARYAATNMIPMVGGTVSGAMSTLVSGLAYSKGVIGGGGIAVIISMATAPLVTLLLYKLAFFLAISFLEFSGGADAARPICALRDALDALISVFALCCVIYIFETILLIKCEVTW